MLSLLLLAPYQNGEWQTKRKVEKGLSRRSKHTFLLPTPPWLIERLVGSGPEAPDLKPLTHLEREAAVVQREVTLNTLCVVTHCSSVLDKESNLLRAYYGWPTDVFGIRIEKAYKLDPPIKVPYCKDRRLEIGMSPLRLTGRFGHYFMPLLDFSMIQNVTAVPDDDKDQRLQLCSLLEVLRQRMGRPEELAEEQDTLAMFVPAALAHLIQLRKWRQLLGLARWLRSLAKQGFDDPFGGWPSVRWVGEAQSLEEKPVAFVCTPEKCLELARTMQGIIAALGVEAECEDSPEDDRSMELQDIQSTLQGWAIHYGELRGDFPGARRSSLGLDLAACSRMVNCIRLARCIRGGGHKLAGAMKKENKQTNRNKHNLI